MSLPRLALGYGLLLAQLAWALLSLPFFLVHRAVHGVLYAVSTLLWETLGTTHFRIYVAITYAKRAALGLPRHDPKDARWGFPPPTAAEQLRDAYNPGPATPPDGEP